MSDPRQDDQDTQFGSAAAEDQEAVDRLSERGVGEEEMPDGPDRHPRAAGKAEPEGE